MSGKTGPTIEVFGAEGVTSAEPFARMRTRQRRAILAATCDPLDKNCFCHPDEAAHYQSICRAFVPLLERIGPVVVFHHPESQLDYQVWRALENYESATALSFLPFQSLYLTRHSANVAYCLWAYPHFPDRDNEDCLRGNWVRLANQLSLILTPSRFTAETLLRSGVHTPVRVVPVPVASKFFELESWNRDAVVTLDGNAEVIVGRQERSTPESDPWEPRHLAEKSVKSRLRAMGRKLYKRFMKPALGGKGDRALTLFIRRLRTLLRSHGGDPKSQSKPLALSGVVYTTVLDPADSTQDWPDLISAFVYALRDCPDATLLVQLRATSSVAVDWAQILADYTSQLQQAHACKIAIRDGDLTDEQKAAALRATTYYITASRAESACEPLQQCLAAGRPAITCVHSAIGGYVDDSFAFVVASHPEPTNFPLYALDRYATRRNGIDWQSLHDQIRGSYEIAKHHPEEYCSRAERGRAAMSEWASEDRVEKLLAEAFAFIGQLELEQLQERTQYSKAS